MDNQNNKATKATFYIRIAVAMYLLYIDYSLIFSKEQISPLESKIMVLMVIIFAVSAAILIVSSIKGLNRINKGNEDTDQ